MICKKCNVEMTKGWLNKTSNRFVPQLVAQETAILNIMTGIDFLIGGGFKKLKTVFAYHCEQCGDVKLSTK